MTHLRAVLVKVSRKQCKVHPGEEEIHVLRHVDNCNPGAEQHGKSGAVCRILVGIVPVECGPASLATLRDAWAGRGQQKKGFEITDKVMDRLHIGRMGRGSARTGKDYKRTPTKTKTTLGFLEEYESTMGRGEIISLTYGRSLRGWKVQWQRSFRRPMERAQPRQPIKVTNWMPKVSQGTILDTRELAMVGTKWLFSAALLLCLGGPLSLISPKSSHFQAHECHSNQSRPSQCIVPKETRTHPNQIAGLEVETDETQDGRDTKEDSGVGWRYGGGGGGGGRTTTTTTTTRAPIRLGPIGPMVATKNDDP